MFKLNKHVLLVLAVLLMLVLIPTAFAGGVDDDGAVGVDNQSAADCVFMSSTDDVDVESESQSAAVDKVSESDDSDVLEFDDYEIDIVAAEDDVSYVDGFDESGGSGTIDDPYHSLADAIVGETNGREIRLLSGTYDFNRTIDIGTERFVLTAFGDEVIFTTSNGCMFKINDVCDVTFNGIQFKDSNVNNQVIINGRNSRIGTLNFNNCSFINNKGEDLISSSCNVNVKGCTFIDNEATGSQNINGGLIQNYWTNQNTINISYSIFMNNKIAYNNNPIIVDYRNGNGPAVVFNYNFVNGNDEIADGAIAYNARITKVDYTVISGEAPSEVNAGETVDLVVNFTKSDGSALDDYMPNFTVSLLPVKVGSSIPVLISKNGGKGQYVTRDEVSYSEIVDIAYGENYLTEFRFDVNGSHALLDPELSVPNKSIILYNGSTVDINATHVGDGVISYEVKSGSQYIALEGSTITGVDFGTSVVRVSVSMTDLYDFDSFDVTVNVMPIPVYVDGLYGVGGSGTIDDPYHSLADAIVGETNGREIRLLPGTYDFVETIKLETHRFVLTAFGDEVIFTTSNGSMFNINLVSDVTFNGIQFKDSNVNVPVVIYGRNAQVGTLNFNNCSFINNKGQNLFFSSCNVNVKGCTFIDNEAKGASYTDGGLINNYYSSQNTINISYSIFMNNKIAYNNNPIIVDYRNGNGPAVVFNYNFVNGNDEIADGAIAYNARITKVDYTVISGEAPSEVNAGETVDLVVNFTKSDGSALDDYMPNFTVSLLPVKVGSSIPVLISKNGGKGQYVARDEVSYTEIVDIAYGENYLTKFRFGVNGSHALLDPELSVPESLTIKFGSAVEINATHLGDGIISCAIKSGSEYIALEGNVIRGIGVGTAVVFVRVSETDVYDSDVLEVIVNVVPGPFYVDAFDGVGGRGTIDNPYHSLKNVLSDSSFKNHDIYLLPGTYDFNGATVNIIDVDFTLNAMGDVILTSSDTLFKKTHGCILTFNGIQFKDITASSSVILWHGSSDGGILNFNNCSFINNTGDNLIWSSYILNVKGCTFIDNIANYQESNYGGLFHNWYGSNINISYSVFINNKIYYDYGGHHPLIIDDNNANVYFDYNIVDDNAPLDKFDIALSYNELASYSRVNITAAPISEVSAGDTVDLVVNFTKSDGSPLDDYMPTLNVELLPTVIANSIPVTITNNSGKGQYVAENRAYTEIVDVKCREYVLNTFEFYVSQDNLLNPELAVPKSLTVDMGVQMDINATHLGDGVVSYVIANESVATVDDNGIITAIAEGITTITVTISATDTYGVDIREVKLMVKDPADGDAIYVDGFDGVGGSGIKVDPYHSLINVLVEEYSGKEIRLLPGTYDFTRSIFPQYNTSYVITAYGGDVIFTTSTVHMFEPSYYTDLTFIGIKFRDSYVNDVVFSDTTYGATGNLAFINCDFINNTGYGLIKSGSEVTIKGCNFIDNTVFHDRSWYGGLINNHYLDHTINISYSNFINNDIQFDNGLHPIVVDVHDYNIDNNLEVIFNYNFVNGNRKITDDEIAYHATIIRDDYTIMTFTVPDEITAGDTADLVINFTKSDGSALDDYMANLTVNLVPTQIDTVIPVTISNNGGKGQYASEGDASYTEHVNVELGGYILTKFAFDVKGSYALLDPELSVPESLTVYKGFTADINATQVGDGVISYTIISGSEYIALEGSTITGVDFGTSVVRVRVSDSDIYASDSFDVTVIVKQIPIYVDGFDGVGGSGTIDDPYHSIKTALVSQNSGREIMLLPGIYDFNSSVEIGDYNTFELTAAGDDVIFTTSYQYMFHANEEVYVTFNGITFKDSNVDSTVIFNIANNCVGTLNFNNCRFINNTGYNLIKTSCNVNVKGCTFIDNKATGESYSDGGLINNYYSNLNTINVCYSIFVNNTIAYNSIIVDYINGNGPLVIFDYNFVNDNNEISYDEIAYHSRIAKDDYTVITAIAPSGNVSAGDVVDLMVKFTKSDGSDLDGYMPDLTVELAPRVKTGSIPVTITKNSGKGQYVANDADGYWETVDVIVNGNNVTNFQFYVYKPEYYGTNISADDLVMSYKDGSAWNATLTDVYGNAISGATVKIGIDINGVKKVYTFITDSNGVVSLPINLISGTYAINATFEGDGVYEASFTNATVTVNKATAILTGDDIEMSYKDGTDWVVTLTDLNGNAISGVKVAFGVLSKVYSILTDDNGVAKLPINLPSGNYTVTASFYNSKYEAETISATVIVNKAIPVLSAEDLVMSYKDGSAWDVTLTDANGNAMANTYVKFTVSGKTYSRKTNENGVASLPINLVVGTYDISATYESSNFNVVEISKTVVVNPPEYEIVADDINMTYQDGTSYNVQITDAQGSPVAQAGVVIKVTINGKSYDRKTNADGIASLPINLRAGSYEITAEYNGKQITNTIVVNNA